MSLTFDALREANKKRCPAVFHPIDSWSEMEWGGCAAGELGEALNKLKKRLRGDPLPVPTAESVADELADTICYMDLLAERMGIDLGAAVIRKFNKVSDKKNTNIKL